MRSYDTNLFARFWQKLRRTRTESQQISAEPEFEELHTPYLGGWAFRRAIDEFVPLNAAAQAMRDAHDKVLADYRKRIRKLNEQIMREQMRAGKDNTPVCVELKEQRDALEKEITTSDTEYIAAIRARRVSQKGRGGEDGSLPVPDRSRQHHSAFKLGLRKPKN
jgi:hypothetical protein